jgi:hypothetical protein
LNWRSFWRLIQAKVSAATVKSRRKIAENRTWKSFNISPRGDLLGVRFGVDESPEGDCNLFATFVSAIDFAKYRLVIGLRNYTASMPARVTVLRISIQESVWH